MKTIHLLLSISFVLSMMSCTEGPKKEKAAIPAADERIPVRVMTISSGNHLAAINCSGQFTTEDETFLSFKTGGLIESILAKEGEYVRKGQILAKLNLTEIQAATNQAHIAYEKAKRDQKRAKNLFQDSVATLEQVQNAGSMLEIATQNLRAVEFNKQFSVIRAQSDGYILSKMANQGQIVGPGTPIFQTNGAGAKKWLLKVNLSDEEWSQCAENDSAIIQINLSNTQIYPAKLLRKMASSNPLNGAFQVQLEFIGEVPENIASGLFAKAQIFPRTNNKTWEIPYAALLDGNNNTGYVFTTNDGKTAKKQAVIIDRFDRDQIYISKGLENAGSLIISGNAYLKDQSLIQIVE